MGTSVNIPQANSVETLVYIVEAIRDGVDTLETLAVEFDVRERTIHYYLELAEWLGFLADRKADTYVLTSAGSKFADTVAARGQLYSDGVRQHDLVVSALEQAAGDSYDDLKAAFVTQITELGVLAEATARRRAGALATLVGATLDDAVDWKTGRIGQPTRMRRTYKATDRAPSADDQAETTTWERPRDPVALVGEDRFDRLGELIRDVLADIGEASSSTIRDELSLRFGIPLTDPAVFVVLRAGLEDGEWQADAHGRYSLR